MKCYVRRPGEYVYALPYVKREVIVNKELAGQEIVNAASCFKEATRFGTNRAKAMILKNPDLLKKAVQCRGGWYTPTMGTDPEIFLKDKSGKNVPAFNVLKPKQTGARAFWDGFQAEFAIPEGGQGCLQSLAYYIQYGLDDIRQQAKCSVDFDLTDAIPVDKALLQALPDEHVELGCDPSINAYGTPSGVHSDPRELPWRFAGGHIHFGDTYLRALPEMQKMGTAIKTVMDLDKTLGVWSIAAFQALETTKVRRKYYGLAGEFRLPNHGLEYRTLSNHWLCAPEVYYITFEMARMFYRASLMGLLDFWYGPEDAVQHTINEYDVPMAKALLKKNERLFKLMVSKCSQNFGYYAAKTNDAQLCGKQAFRLGMDGVGALIAKPLDVIGNWRLTGWTANVTGNSVSGDTWGQASVTWK